MAENLSIDGNPDEAFLKAYGEWADGDWGMVMTGKNFFLSYSISYMISTKYMYI